MAQAVQHADRQTSSEPSVVRFALTLALAAVCGGLAGAAAGMATTPTIPTVAVSIPARQPFPAVTPTSTSATDAGSLVRVAPRTTPSIVPPAVLTRRASPVAAVYHRAKGTTLEERTLTEDRLLGSAVSLTSDGWFVTTAAVIGAHPLADMTIWQNGKSYAVLRGAIDRVNGTAYLKVQASELPTPAFGDVSDLVAGSEVWVERRASSFVPSLTLSLSERVPSIDPASSETATRRIRLHGVTDRLDVGSPAWGANGSLLGIVESADGEPYRIIPVASIASSAGALLSTGVITHARLGVQAADLSAWRIDGERGALPTRGALLKDNRKLGKSAVAKDSPAFLAGLKAGDVILAVEHDILDGTADLGEILSEYRAASNVTLRVNRDGKEIDVPVILGSAVTSDSLK